MSLPAAFAFCKKKESYKRTVKILNKIIPCTGAWRARLLGIGAKTVSTFLIVAFYSMAIVCSFQHLGIWNQWVLQRLQPYLLGGVVDINGINGRVLLHICGPAGFSPKRAIRRCMG